MYKGASNSLVRISIVFFFLFYLAFLLIEMDLDLFWLKVKWTLFSKSFHFLFSRLGWCSGGFLLAAIFLSDPELGNLMMASASEGTSGTQLQVPLLSSASSLPTSISSRGASWIDESYPEEVSSSAPNQEQQQREEDRIPPTGTPPAAGPSEPIGDPTHAPLESPRSLSLSEKEVLQQFLFEEGAAVEQQLEVPF